MIKKILNANSISGTQGTFQLWLISKCTDKSGHLLLVQVPTLRTNSS